jgi:ferric-dicitrate binding protein FerR (iron transport regulator)
MSKIPDVQQRCIQRASQWLERFVAGDELSATDIREWEQWIMDPLHRREYNELVKMRQQLTALPRPGLPTADELQNQSVHISEDIREHMRDRQQPLTRVRRSNRSGK